MNETKAILNIFLPGRGINTEGHETAVLTNKISYKSYKWMTSAESCPNPALSRVWKSMSQKKRLLAHMKALCEDRGGVKFTYEVIE